MIAHRLTIGLLVAVVSPPLNNVAAQVRTDPADAVVAAAEYALQDVSQAPGEWTGSAVLIDIGSAFWTHDNAGLAETTRAAAMKIASRLGARLGKLESAITCPNRAPTVEELASGYWGCRMVSGTDMIIQVSNPTFEADTMFVWVGIWQEVADARGRTRFVSGHGREVKLLSNDAGNWVPVGIRGGTFIHR